MPEPAPDFGVSGAEAAAFAHDLRNLLATVVGHADIQLSQIEVGQAGAAGAASLVASLRAIRVTSGRAADLCEDLLALARGVPGAKETLDLAEVAAAAQVLFEARCGHREACRLSGAPGLGVCGHRLALERAILNLLWNAREAGLGTGQEHPDILLSWGRGSSGPWIEVRDTGPGLPEGRLGGLQEPFRSTRGAGGVRGLGLHAAAAVMQAHGGRLAGRNSPGGGAILRLEFGLERELDFGAGSSGAG